MSFPSSGIGSSLPGVQLNAALPIREASVVAAPSMSPSTAEGDEFHAWVEGGAGAGSTGGLMSMLKGVDGSRKAAESALVNVVSTGDPTRMYDATAAMARFNLQTLVLNKLASKVGQAVDRLTNLQ